MGGDELDDARRRFEKVEVKSRGRVISQESPGAQRRQSKRRGAGGGVAVHHRRRTHQRSTAISTSTSNWPIVDTHTHRRRCHPQA